MKLARSGLTMAAALLAANADQTTREVGPCSARGTPVLVYESSRLSPSGAGQLALTRGRAMPCGSAAARSVVAALERALESFPGERLRTPTRVHVDPHLPNHEAPVADIEVHATSREILLASAALPRLPAEAWTHELLHALAPPPPVDSLVGRRLWLTLEEGLVSYLTLALEPYASRQAATSGAWDARSAAWEELALPEYDPHSLARGLALELSSSAPEPHGGLDALLDCLMTDPAPGTRGKLREVAITFVSRCKPEPARWLASATGRWLPEPLSPWPEPGARVVAARDSETR